MPKINLLNTSNRNNSNFANNLETNENIKLLNSKYNNLDTKFNNLNNKYIDLVTKYDLLVTHLVDSSLNVQVNDISDTILTGLKIN